MMMVYLYAIVGVAAIAVGTFPVRRDWVPLSGDEKLAVVAIVLSSAWPMACTFLVGPLLVKTPDSPLFPVLWYLPAVIVVLLIVGRNINRDNCRIDLPVALLLTLAPIALLLLLQEGVIPGDIMRWGLALLLMLGVLCKADTISIAAVACGSRLALFTTTAATVAAIVLNPAIVTSCRVDKCGSAGLVLTSPFAGNGNILGLSVVLMLPLAMFATQWWRAVALIPGVVLYGELAGSRTAFIGLGAAVLAFALYRLVRPQFRFMALVLVLAAAVVLSLAPAVLVFGDGSFSYRGALWNQAKDMIAAHPFLGQGPLAWEHLNASSLYTANYSPHNAWLDFGVAVGIWGIVVIIAAVALKVWLSSGEERAALLVYFICVVATSTLESIFVPYFIGIVPFAVIAPMFIGPGRRTVDTVSTGRRRARRNLTTTSIHERVTE